MDCKPETTETIIEPTEIPKAPEAEDTHLTSTTLNSKPIAPTDKSALQTLNELAKHHKVCSVEEKIDQWFMFISGLCQI